MKDKDDEKKVIQIYDENHKLCNIKNPFAMPNDPKTAKEQSERFNKLASSLYNMSDKEINDWKERANEFRTSLIKEFTKRKILIIFSQ